MSLNFPFPNPSPTPNQPLEESAIKILQILSSAVSNGVLRVTGSGGGGGGGTWGSITGDIEDQTDLVNYVAQQIAAALVNLADLKGAIPASGNPNYPAASAADYYYVTVAGKVGGASGISVAVGDVVMAIADNAGGTQAAVGTNWIILQAGIPGLSVVGLALATIPSPSAIRYIQINADNTVSVLSAAQLLAAIGGVGQQTIGNPALAMTPALTNGPSFGQTAVGGSLVNVGTLDFDPTTQEFAWFSVSLPKSWDLGNLQWRARWSHAATTVNFGVAWELQAGYVGDNASISGLTLASLGVLTDTGGTTDNQYVTALSTAAAVGGSPAAGGTIFFRMSRNPADGSDNMAIDARLINIDILYTTNAGNDS